MTNRKNYNSIVFLTTLGVYLGLVLAGGATPSVFAQAALTRDFDIKNEIVIEDDLDKKPDDKEFTDFENSLESYFTEVGRFVKNLQKLHQIGKFDLRFNSFEVNELGFVPCNVDGDPIRTSSLSKRIDNRWLEPALTEARYSFESWNFLSDCLKDNELKTGISKGSNLKLVYDQSELKVELSGFKLSPQKADQQAANFNQTLKLHEVNNDATVKKIYENTSFKSENNQVFIVTRLPRASIDALLAENNAR